MKKCFVIMLVLLVIVCGCDRKKNKIKDDKLPVGTSNEKSKDKLQVRVIIEQINIRKDSTTESDKIGIVKEGSTFDVIDYESDGKYIWFHIKTGNKIEGYIASEIENPYVETNKEIDFEPPTMTFLNDPIEVNYRSDIEEAIKNNVVFSDNKDDNVKFEYNVNYGKELGDKYYLVTIKAIDKNDNYSTKNIKVKINAEKQMSDGKWITYNDFINIQNRINSLCPNYGFFDNIEGTGCNINNEYFQVNVSYGIDIYLYYPYQYCYYKEDLTVEKCYDNNGNDVIHDLMSDDFKSLESTWLPRIKSYYEEVKNITGYEFDELRW